jgi:hypothetical protein
MQGYIKDHRKELNSDIWQMPPLYHRVWQWLKYQVNHNDAEIPMRDGTKLVIRKGQHLTSVRKIARGVGYYEKGLWEEPNPKTVANILTWMAKNHMITISRGKDMRQYTLITILNWETYQMIEDHKPQEGEGPNPPPERRKKKEAKYSESSSYFKMAKYFYGKVAEMSQAEGLSHLIIKADLQKWADDMRKLIEIDKVDKHLAKAVMDWVVKDNFWKKNVLSAKKFRDKFPELAIKMKSSKSTTEGGKPPPKDIRDKEIEFQRWVQEGGDPNEFNWGK